MTFNYTKFLASIPLLVAATATILAIFFPAVGMFLANNPMVLDYVIAGLSMYLPSMIAADRYGNAAD